MLIAMKCGFCKPEHYYGKLVDTDEKKPARCPNCNRKLIPVKIK